MRAIEANTETAKKWRKEAGSGAQGKARRRAGWKVEGGGKRHALRSAAALDEGVLAQERESSAVYAGAARANAITSNAPPKSGSASSP
jgi:hypothetical protein